MTYREGRASEPGLGERGERRERARERDRETQRERERQRERDRERERERERDRETHTERERERERMRERKYRTEKYGVSKLRLSEAMITKWQREKHNSLHLSLQKHS